MLLLIHRLPKISDNPGWRGNASSRGSASDIATSSDSVELFVFSFCLDDLLYSDPLPMVNITSTCMVISSLSWWYDSLCLGIWRMKRLCMPLFSRHRLRLKSYSNFSCATGILSVCDRFTFVVLGWVLYSCSQERHEGKQVRSHSLR